ncbi:MAG TPA: T9SS C-terminal target domain-containing protein, partial [Candidatus Cloacimonadota bacterium]|nr:T9SS C-terminal target domain-containing protein [Candidatus Cloacimonadota bacterium]
MKRFVLVLLVISISVLFAQEIPDIFANLRHSARTTEGNLVLRYESTPDYVGTNTCYYSTDGGAWTGVSPYQLNDVTYEALVPYDYGQNLQYRLRLAYEIMGYEAVAMHAAYLDSDSFPPTLDKMGWIATDATGDSMMVYSNKLDLTDTWFAATDTKFYSAMANVFGSFPTMNTYTSYNAYITTIVNTSAITDSVAYAMVYSGIPVLLSNGLYKLTFSTQGIPTFARIGDISAQVVSGKLHMACDIADLTNDPQFGEWPNEFNALAISSMTLSAALVGGQPQFGLGDYSTPVLMGFDKHFYNHAQNSLPQIAWS